MRKTAQAPVSGLELFFYSIESGTRNLHLAMRTTSAAAAGAAATAATLAASATDHGFSGLLIMYHGLPFTSYMFMTRRISLRRISVHRP